MSELRTMLKLELGSYLGINKFLHTHDIKEKKRYGLMIGVYALLIVILCAYVGGLVYGLCFLGLADIVPIYLAVVCSLLLLFFNIFTAGNRIFGQRGYDILSAMPIRSNSVVLSRFIAMYLADLAFTLLVMLTGIITYGVMIKPSFEFYLIAILGSIFIPAIPLAIATALGSVVLAISSRVKNKSLIQTVLMIVLVVGVMILSFSLGNMTEEFTTEQFTQLVNTIGGVLEKIYYPSVWLKGAFIDFDIIKLLIFLGASIGVIAITMLILSACFHRVMRRLLSFSAKHNYKIGQMGSNSMLKALVIREGKRYFASSIYVVNTIVGPILATILSIVVLISGLQGLQTAIEPLVIDVVSLLPFVTSAIFCMMPPSSVSISMEGKQFWIVKSLPVPTKTLLDSKILFNLLLASPFYLISTILLGIATNPTPLEIVWIALIPLCIIIFTVVLGVTINLKFHSFDWEREDLVVKQSVPAFLGGFSGMLLSVILGAIVYLVPVNFAYIPKIAMCVILLTGAILLYISNNKKQLNNL